MDRTHNQKLRGGISFVAALAVASIIGLVDVATGYDINLGLFYLLPIALATWYGGRATGLFLSVVCVTGMFFVDNFVTRDMPFPSNNLIPYWNMAIRLGYFVVFSWLLHALKGALDREKSYARRDYLTGAANAQAFYETARVEFEAARFSGRALSIAYMDCDNFKEINDRLGHSAGDELLRVTAGTVRANVRLRDLVARLGGDEFGLLMPESDFEGARQIVNTVKEELLAAMARRGWNVTFSIGIATFITLPDNVDEAIKASDQLMYEVKSNGKNSIAHEVFGR